MKAKSPIPQGRIVLNENLISWKDIDGEVVFLQKEEKKFYELNKTASFIWKVCVKYQKIPQVIRTMQERYRKVNKTIIEKDTLDFIKQLVDKKLFIIQK